MTRPVQIGLIGCGSVAVGCYLPLLERLNPRRPAGEVMIACDRDPDRAPHLKERFGITVFTTDPAEVLGNPAVDARSWGTGPRRAGGGKACAG